MKPTPKSRGQDLLAKCWRANAKRESSKLRLKLQNLRPLLLGREKCSTQRLQLRGACFVQDTFDVEGMYQQM